MSKKETPVPESGDPVNLVPFGRISYWSGSDPLSLDRHDMLRQGDVWLPVDVSEQSGPHIGVEWDTPRRFSRVVVRYADATGTPTLEQSELQYWHHTWPEQWAGGWTAVDDPFNGKWVTAHGDVEVEGDTWTYTFDPLDITELDSVDDFAVTYRQALKVRLSCRGPAPGLRAIQVYSDSVWKEAALRVQFRLGDSRLTYGGQVEVHDGYVLDVDDADPQSIFIKVLYADGVPTDRTVVTVNGTERRFSFLVSDALAEGIYIPDLGVFVGEASKRGHEAWKQNQPANGPLPIYDRVPTEPEQTYDRARKEIPQLIKAKQGPWGRYCPIACDANRQEFAIRYNGDIFADKHAIKAVGRDTARLLWPGKSIFFKFPTGDPPCFREEEDATAQSALRGYLPVYTSTWKDAELVYEMTSFATLLYEDPWEEERKRGDEPVVALSRIKIHNATTQPRRARFWVVVENPEKLVLDSDGFIYALGRARPEDSPEPPGEKKWTVEPYPVRRMRAFIRTNGVGKAAPVSCTYPPLAVRGISNAVAYDLQLEQNQSHEIDLFIPFTTFTGDDGRDAVAAPDYDRKLNEMIEYWEAEIQAGARIDVPEKLLNDFNRANLAHIAITADKDVDSGLYILGAGTWDYQIYGTETIDQVRSLDLRGYHERARKYMMPFVECQGTRRMSGRFTSQEGTLHGVRVSEELDCQVGDYSLDHGAVLWMLGEHYRLTRDANWLRSIASNIVTACDYVTRERQATMKLAADGTKVWEYGLLPPARLDDNPEWLYWYTVNAVAYRAMQSAADVLAEIDHPDAARLADDACAYGEDIRNAVMRSTELSPVVRLADGTYVPHTPVRCQLRGRDVGWIRESLYGPLHFVDCGLMEPNAQETTWILKDYEDNIFVSPTVGRQVDLDRSWFSQGGITIQSNLLPNTLVYLTRGQVEHALRAFYNSFAANLYADVRCFTEHPVAAYGLGAGPFYKTSDEAAFLTWLRYLLLSEREDVLVIAPGTPRKWLEHRKEITVTDAPTYFGPLSYRITSEISNARIHIRMRPPRRNPPKRLEIHLRHPDKLPMKSVQLNGAPHSDFDPAGESVVLHEPFPTSVEMAITY